MSRKQICISTFTLNGKQLSGPVLTENGETFTFVNRANEWDYYFELSKASGRWYKSGGPSYDVPQNIIDSVGRDIENALRGKS